MNRFAVALFVLVGCASDPVWHPVLESGGIEVRALESDGDTVLAGTRDGRILTFSASGSDAALVAELQSPLRGVSGLKLTDASLWVTGPGGVAQRSGETWAVIDSLAGKPLRVVFSVVEASDASLWFGANGGVLTAEGGLISERPWNEGFPHRVIHAALRDAAGQTWYAARTGLGRSSDGQISILYPEINFGSVLEAQDGALWFGTRGHGALRILGEGHEWTGEDIDLFPVLQTVDGDLWAVSETEGALFLGADGWAKPLSTPGSASNRFFDVTEDAEGRIWLASAEGVFVLKNR